MTFGKYSSLRCHFERDVKLTKEIPVMIADYERAAEKAYNSAQMAVKLGDIESMRKAQWDEAVVSAIEGCIGCFAVDNDFYDIDRPSFEH